MPYSSEEARLHAVVNTAVHGVILIDPATPDKPCLLWRADTALPPARSGLYAVGTVVAIGTPLEGTRAVRRWEKRVRSDRAILCDGYQNAVAGDVFRPAIAMEFASAQPQGDIEHAPEEDRTDGGAG